MQKIKMQVTITQNVKIPLVKNQLNNKFLLKYEDPSKLRNKWEKSSR